MNELDDKNRNSQIWTVKGNRWGKNRAVGTYETIEKEYLCHWRPRKRKWSLTCILSKDGWRLPKLGNRCRFKKLKNPRQDNPKKKKFRPRHVIKILKIKEKNYCMIILCLTFWGTVILFFHSDCTILHSHQPYTRVLIFSHLYQPLLLSVYFILFYFFNNSHHSNVCEVVFHWGFDLHFSDKYWYWASFHVHIDTVNHFWRNVYSSPLSIF